MAAKKMIFMNPAAELLFHCRCVAHLYACSNIGWFIAAYHAV